MKIFIFSIHISCTHQEASVDTSALCSGRNGGLSILMDCVGGTDREQSSTLKGAHPVENT